MGKRIVLGGLLAVGLSLVLGGSAQAQYYGGGGYGYGSGGYHHHHHHHGYSNYGYGRGPVLVTPVYRPSLYTPYYGGYGSRYIGGYGSPYLGGYGYGSYGGISLYRPGFGISIGFRR